ncbi:hypothetical protein EV643_14612 [Kribbella sp. VKM Ac-2527]|uniref:Uncharacterized protein n=1 Tax=Kribbella caucasensis TaxID=2512215 RepID=A0A4V3C5F1_9ACTN|nr:hypothetical protein [Kribbella sp. VKM Ac-2527]TDO29648.1 hypothetical protein EV643_14612 [Kribbella sp. VKM Ac-2527]
MATEQPEREGGRTRPVRAAMIIAAAVAVTLLSGLLTALGVLYLGGDPAPSGQGAVPLPATSTTPTAPPATATRSPTPTKTPTRPSPTKAPPPVSPSPTSTPFAYQPLWPFASVADAAAWQQAYRTNGQQPWHLDADQTALSFTTGFLGFTEIDRVVSRSVNGNDARISVGYQSTEGPASVSAVLHLVRIGQGQDAPWEVVGTADTTLTLERPRYAAAATSPITVGGRISGVDESIRIDVRQPSSEQPLGSSCCVPGGGDRQPWSTQVTYRGASDPALTIVASTGGHVQTVERFAITAIRPG